MAKIPTAPGDGPAQEPSEEGAASTAIAPVKTKKYEPSWSGVGQLLTDGDLDSPAARKMLVNELSRLTQETESLAEFRDLFHEADKKSAVLEESVARSTSFNTASAIIVSVGAIVAGLGASEIFEPGRGWFALALVVVGTACVFVPVVALWVKR